MLGQSVCASVHNLLFLRNIYPSASWKSLILIKYIIYFFQCTLPFDLGPRRRTRTYSFSGSERSHAATPTPSEVEGLTEDESQPALESANDLPQTEVSRIDAISHLNLSNFRESARMNRYTVCISISFKILQFSRPFAKNLNFLIFYTTFYGIGS